MSERDRLEQLAARTGLLAMRATAAEMAATAAQFIRLAAAELQADGWRLVRADPPKTNVGGFRLDKLIHRDTLQIVDVIVNADAPDGPLRRVSWDDKGRGERDEVGPELPTTPGNGEPGNGEPGNGGDGDEAPEWIRKIADDLGAIAGALEDTANLLRELLPIARDIRDKGVTLRWR